MRVVGVVLLACAAPCLLACEAPFDPPLPKVVEVEGRILSQGSPIAGAIVTTQLDPAGCPAVNLSYVGAVPATDTTDSDGRFSSRPTAETDLSQSCVYVWVRGPANSESSNSFGPARLVDLGRDPDTLSLVFELGPGSVF